MRILLIDPDPVNPYGTFLADALSASGNEVEFVTAVGNPNTIRTGARTWRVAPESAKGRYLRKMSQEISYLHLITQRLRRFKPDIVHFEWMRLPAEIGFLAGIRCARIPIVWTAHNVQPHEAARFDRLYYRALYAIPNGIVVHAYDTAATLRSKHPWLRVPIRVVRPGLWDAEMNATEMDTARRMLGIPGAATVFLLFGQLRPYKGWTELLRAFSRVANTARDAHLIIAGRATATVGVQVKRELERMSEESSLRITSVVSIDRFLNQETTRRVFAASDCVVLPYREVSHSGVLHQALGYGRAALLPSLDGFREIIRDGETGFFYEAGDADALGEALNSLSGRRETVRWVGRNARAELAKGMTWRRAANDTASLYREVLCGQASAGVDGS